MNNTDTNLSPEKNEQISNNELFGQETIIELSIPTILANWLETLQTFGALPYKNLREMLEEILLLGIGDYLDNHSLPDDFLNIVKEKLYIVVDKARK
ncbi:MAG: hypothetical protein ACTSP5_10040 [Candidatus Heimdallarchaeota archaeon]